MSSDDFYRNSSDQNFGVNNTESAENLENSLILKNRAYEETILLNQNLIDNIYPQLKDTKTLTNHAAKISSSMEAYSI